MKGRRQLHSKSTLATDSWRTPPAFIKYVENYFDVKFNLDMAASDANAICNSYFSINNSALIKPIEDYWSRIIWCNPPYSKIKEFVTYILSNKIENVYLLVPARTDTTWFSECYEYARGTYFIKGRLKFIPEKGKGSSAPFPSVLFQFTGYNNNNRGKKISEILKPTTEERGFNDK